MKGLSFGSKDYTKDLKTGACISFFYSNAGQLVQKIFTPLRVKSLRADLSSEKFANFSNLGCIPALPVYRPYQPYSRVFYSTGKVQLSPERHK